MIADASLSLQSENNIFIQGKIHFGNVLALMSQGKDILDTVEQVQIDLGGVTQSDSSGLSLLIRWLHYASKQQKSICYINLPQCLSDLGRVSGVDTLLPIVIHSRAV